MSPPPPPPARPPPPPLAPLPPPPCSRAGGGWDAGQEREGRVGSSGRVREVGALRFLLCASPPPLPPPHPSQRPSAAVTCDARHGSLIVLCASEAGARGKGEKNLGGVGASVFGQPSHVVWTASPRAPPSHPTPHLSAPTPTDELLRRCRASWPCRYVAGAHGV